MKDNTINMYIEKLKNHPVISAIGIIVTLYALFQIITISVKYTYEFLTPYHTIKQENIFATHYDTLDSSSSIKTIFLFYNLLITNNKKTDIKLKSINLYLYLNKNKYQLKEHKIFFNNLGKNQKGPLLYSEFNNGYIGITNWFPPRLEYLKYKDTFTISLAFATKIPLSTLLQNINNLKMEICFTDHFGNQTKKQVFLDVETTRKSVTNKIIYLDYKKDISNARLPYLSIYEKASAYQETGQFNKSIEEYLKAIKSNPNDELLHYDLAIAYTSNKEINKAIKEYKRSITISPNYCEAKYNLAILYEKSSKIDKAITYYQEFLNTYKKTDYYKAAAETSLKHLKNKRNRN